MVYYLRPAGHKFHSPSHSSYRYRASPVAGSPSPPLPTIKIPKLSPFPSNSSMSSTSSMSSMSDKYENENFLQKLTPYLVLTVIVAAVTAVVILQGVKPSENCAKFLTVTEDDGTVKVSPLKVTGLSVGVGLLVSLLSFAVHSLQPSLLDL